MSASWMSKRGPLIFLAVLLASLLPSLLRIAWPFLTSFILASMLAIVINPANKWLGRRIHRLGLATFFTTFATVFLLGIILAFAGFALAQELTTTYDGLSRRSLEEGGWPALVTHTADRVVDALATRLPLNTDAVRTELLDGMRTVTGYLRNNVGAAVGGVTSVLITGLLTTIFLYFLLRHGEDWIDRLAALTPLAPRVTASLFQTVHSSVVANVNGVLAVAFGQGLFLSLAFLFAAVAAMD
jgi:predicted PurR-regulated permease PerM